MKKTLFFCIALLIIFLVGCSIDEPYTQTSDSAGSSPLNPLYMVTTNTSESWLHGTQHQFLGDDEVDVTDLSGLLGDGQNVKTDAILPNVTLDGILSITDDTIHINSTNNIRTQTTGAGTGLISLVEADGNLGVAFTTMHDSNSPATYDTICTWYGYGKNSIDAWKYYVKQSFRILDPTSGSEDGEVRWALMDEGVVNTAMTLDGAGNLKVDSGFTTYDEHDDAKLLKDGIGNNEIQKLINAGVFSQKTNNKGNIIINEYMVDIVKFERLLAGGIYQNRDYIESLEARIEKLEALLK